MRSAVRAVVLILATWPVAIAPGQCVEHMATVTGANEGAFAEFGAAVDVRIDLAIVGAPHDTHQGLDSGAAYVLRRDGPSWPVEATLRASDGADGDAFGLAAAIDDDVAIVGSFLDVHAGRQSGSAYIYRFDGSAWIEEAKLVPDGVGAQARFGFAVDIQNDVAIIGAFTDDPAGAPTGAAYIYRFDGALWQEETRLLASDGEGGDTFGFAVGLDDGLAVVGARFARYGGIQTGAAYVYRFDGSAWAEEAKVAPAAAAYFDSFGLAVGISGDAIVVGSLNDDTNAPNAGAAYVFRHDGASWVEEAVLLAAGGASGDWLGHEVDLDGDIAVVGAPNDDDLGGDSGSAFVFAFDGTRWIQQAQLTAPAGGGGEGTGYRVAVDGAVVIAGSPFDSAPGAGAGSAELFLIDPPCVEVLCPAHADDYDRSPFVGGPVLGDATLLCASDDQHLAQVRAFPPAVLLPDARLEFWVNTSIAPGAAASIGYLIEAGATAIVPGGQHPRTLRTSIARYAGGGSFVLVDERATADPFADETITHQQDTDAGDHIDAFDGEVRVRVEAFNPGSALNVGWQLRIDQYEVTVTR